VLYAPYMAVSGSQGAVTSEQNVVLLAVFSEAVSGLTTANFKVRLRQELLSYLSEPCDPAALKDAVPLEEHCPVGGGGGGGAVFPDCVPPMDKNLLLRGSDKRPNNVKTSHVL